MRPEFLRGARPVGDRCDLPGDFRRQRRAAPRRRCGRRHESNGLYVRGHAGRGERSGIPRRGRGERAHRHVEARGRPPAHGRARRLPDRSDLRRDDGPVRRGVAGAGPPPRRGAGLAGLFLRVRGDAAGAAQPRRHPRRRVRGPAPEARRARLGARCGACRLQRAARRHASSARASSSSPTTSTSTRATRSSPTRSRSTSAKRDASSATRRARSSPTRKAGSFACRAGSRR